MSAYELESPNTTSLSSIPKNVYPENIQTFVTAPLILSTSGACAPLNYGVFISDSGIRVGSYSVTSSQDAYRIINQSLLSKTGG